MKKWGWRTLRYGIPSAVRLFERNKTNLPKLVRNGETCGPIMLLITLISIILEERYVING